MLVVFCYFVNEVDKDVVDVMVVVVSDFYGLFLYCYYVLKVWFMGKM